MPLPMAARSKNARRRVCSLHISYLLAGGDYAAGKDNKGKGTTGDWCHFYCKTDAGEFLELKERNSILEKSFVRVLRETGQCVSWELKNG